MVSGGPKPPVSGTYFCQNYVNANIKVQNLHSRTSAKEIWQGASWTIWKSKTGSSGFLPFYFKTTPTTSTKRQNKTNKLPLAWEIVIKNDWFFQHFMVNVTASLVYRKLPKFISFNLSPGPFWKLHLLRLRFFTLPQIRENWVFSHWPSKLEYF